MVIYVFLSDLQNKDIISTKDGKVLGRIIDARINEAGIIEELVIEPKRGFKILNATSDIKISFKSIVKMGTDVILVDM